jgi:hypothetical protein
MKSDWAVEKMMMEQNLSDLKEQLREKEEKLSLVTAQKVCFHYCYFSLFPKFFFGHLISLIVFVCSRFKFEFKILVTFL